MADGWSLHCLGSEVLRDYDRLAEGQPLDRAGPVTTFADVGRSPSTKSS